MTNVKDQLLEYAPRTAWIFPTAAFPATGIRAISQPVSDAVFSVHRVVLDALRGDLGRESR